ncbi:hypothetical protein EW146_g1691 [Bondarzewia mesenterica]|uniref:DNA 3'-5' helicase n=1 Tax=Bondarzewia mesenterica TaxID=1095465 RepID=A0A4V3XFZ8_9AGAM|nr:hypothetical protein EW146_g1691 [Bondarzewia mesenterica]
MNPSSLAQIYREHGIDDQNYDLEYSPETDTVMPIEENGLIDQFADDIENSSFSESSPMQRHWLASRDNLVEAPDADEIGQFDDEEFMESASYASYNRHPTVESGLTSIAHRSRTPSFSFDSHSGVHNSSRYNSSRVFNAPVFNLPYSSARNIQSEEHSASRFRDSSSPSPLGPRPTSLLHYSGIGRTQTVEPPNKHAIRLRPVSELPDMYRGLFKFGVFNAIQSTCFDAMTQTNKNMVISAPTGSGKTVLFELAIIRMIMTSGNQANAAKCVYMAPTKALCSERFRDWESKFRGLGIKCCEMTGDTVAFGQSAWGDARNATIIVTTGEKWDSLTRSWRNHGQMLSQIQLFLVDEVHILNESRGSTLEVVMSRMKTRGSAVRLICVSATVPNIDDVANWIGDRDSDAPAQVFVFGEEFRPCKLTRFVYGFPKAKSQNDFLFSSSLNFKLFPLLQRHSAQKPILIFCPTRKGVLTTAEQLMKDYEKSAESKQSLPWSQSRRINPTFHDKRLEKLAQAGIGVHHAGLTIDDKRTTENLFLSKDLRVVVATSTLAVGVNLPAHVVVIKGVKMFQGSAMEEYSDLDIMQMIGRAGRPQFDKEGIAIIMCESELENKYKNLAQGKTILESSLHLNLVEHINSEVGLGTITNVETAKEWLRNSFLFQRVKKNPGRYAVGKQDLQTWQERISDMVTESIKTLKESDLLDYVEEGSSDLCSTAYGDIMSKYYIRQSTMSSILKLPENANLREMVDLSFLLDDLYLTLFRNPARTHLHHRGVGMDDSTYQHSLTDRKYRLFEMRLRAGEKPVLRKLREHEDIRHIDDLFVFQAVLGGIQLNLPEYKTGDSQLNLEALGVFRHVNRISKGVCKTSYPGVGLLSPAWVEALVEVALVKANGAQIKRGLELIRILEGKCWEDRPVVLRQIDKIGDKSIKVLAEHGITNFDSLRKQSPLRLDAILNRKPGFGHEILAMAADLPRYRLTVKEISMDTSGDSVDVELSIECSLILDAAPSTKLKKNKWRHVDMTTLLTVTSDLDYIDFRRIPTKYLKDGKTYSITAKLDKPSQSVCVYVSSESIAGVEKSVQYKPRIDGRHYPVQVTRPKTAIEMDLEGLEDNADFWDMNIDDDDDAIVMKDLTKSKERFSEAAASRDTGQVKKALISEEDNGAFLRKLPNGKYACREGLDKPAPPKSRGHGDGQVISDKSSVKASAAAGSSTNKGKKEKQHKGDNSKTSKRSTQTAKVMKPVADANMKQLETLHERTKGPSKLNLSNGGRLKLPDNLADDSITTPGRKHKSAPNFDMDFADLVDAEPKESETIDELAGDSDLDDNLPELSELLRTGKRKSAPTPTYSDSTNYSNSEMDALIANASIVDAIDLTGEADCQALPAEAVGNLEGTWVSPLFSTPPPKRKYEGIADFPVKRLKGSGPPALGSRANPSPSQVSLQRTVDEPLFYASTSDELRGYDSDSAQKPVMTPQPEFLDDEDFVFDDTLIRIVDANPDPDVTSATLVNPDEEPTKSGMQVGATDHTDRIAERTLSNFEHQITTVEHTDARPAEPAPVSAYFDDIDPLAELQALIDRGTIKLIDG